MDQLSVDRIISFPEAFWPFSKAPVTDTRVPREKTSAVGQAPQATKPALKDKIALAHDAVSRAKDAAEATAALLTTRRMSLQELPTNSSSLTTSLSSNIEPVKDIDNGNGRVKAGRSASFTQPRGAKGSSARLTEAALQQHFQQSEQSSASEKSWTRQGSGRFNVEALPFHCSAEYSPRIHNGDTGGANTGQR
jgi:hypothetical protein